MRKLLSSERIQLVNNYDREVKSLYHEFLTEVLQSGFVQLTQHLSTVHGLVDTDLEIDSYEFEITFVAYDEEKSLSMFSCKENDKIHIFYGHLNSGYFIQKT